MIHLFTAFIYQPFLNILVFFYWVLGLITQGHPDMGIAVILLTIVIRILLLPMSLAEDKSEKDRREMSRIIHELEMTYKNDPVRQRQEIRKLFHSNRMIVIGEFFSLAVQVMISLMLWKMFATGLSGQDLHLIYTFMPKVAIPFNLVFLGKFDLTHPNLLLNIIQSVMIFAVETASIVTSPYPPMKGEVVRLQLILPLVSFAIFMFLPAGKKLFIITTLIISLIIIAYKFVRRKLEEFGNKKADEAVLAAQQQVPQATTVPTPPINKPPEKVLVSVKA